MKNINLKYLDEEKRSYSFPLYVSTRAQLEEISNNRGVSVANLIRHAINEFIDAEKKDAQ